jgi:hypothetical protein
VVVSVPELRRFAPVFIGMTRPAPMDACPNAEVPMSIIAPAMTAVKIFFMVIINIKTRFSDN